MGILIFSFLISGCSSDVHGRYYSTIHENNYIDLYKDGTFIVIEDMNGTTGKYEIYDEEIVLNFDTGMEEKCLFRDGKIFDGDREIYIKKKQ